MRRRLILPIAVGLGIGAGLLPVAMAYHLSRERAISSERAHLREYASWTLQRADVVLARAKRSLNQLASENTEPCSPRHLQRLQQVTIDALSISTIDVFTNGQLACDNWGPTERDDAMRGPDVVLPNGFGLVLRPADAAGPAGSADMIGLMFGPYRAWIKTERLVDVLHDTPMVLGLAARDGQLVALSGQADPRLVERLSKDETSGTGGDKVFSSLRGADFVAFAVSDRGGLEWRVDDELWKHVPIALLISAFVIGLIVWASRKRMSLAGELKTGIHYREFVAHYQPLIDLATGRCVGAEALIRWRKPDGTWVRPDLFIPFAEQHHLIGAVTDILIERVLDDMRDALRADPSMHVAINISSDDIQSGRFLDVLSRAIAKAGVDPSQIWLEATERGFMEAEAARKTLARARDLGHTVAIDDFGTGYSSLSLLESLPLNVLKIDKSFVDAIGRGAATSVVTPSIIEMAHSLKLQTVAEGVETAEQVAYLASAGVEFAQGWFYAKALPPKEFLSFYAQRNASARIDPLRKAA